MSDAYRDNYERIFGKRDTKEFQTGARGHIGDATRPTGGENHYSCLSYGCHPRQVRAFNRRYGHLGHWDKRGVAHFKRAKDIARFRREYGHDKD